MSWDSDFAQPIVLPNKVVVTTLRQVLAYISELPEDQQNSPAWHKARECVFQAADQVGSVWFARIAVMQALQRDRQKRSDEIAGARPNFAKKICGPKLRLPPLEQNLKKISWGQGTYTMLCSSCMTPGPVAAYVDLAAREKHQREFSVISEKGLFQYNFPIADIRRLPLPWLKVPSTELFYPTNHQCQNRPAKGGRQEGKRSRRCV